MFTTLQTRLKKACRWLPVALLPFAAQAQAPANDDPAGAITLPLGATCTPLSTTNTGATTTVVTGLGYTNPGCGIAANPKDVWYKFTTAATGQQGSTAVTITVSGTPAGQVRVFSSAGGAAGPFVTVGCSAGTTNNTQAPPLELRGLTPATTYYVDVSGYGSADTQGAFTICAAVLTLAANDVAVTTVYTLGRAAQSYNSPHVARAVITNLSQGALTNVPVTLTVSGANTFTNTQTVASIAPNTTATVTFASYPLTNAGNNTLTVTVPADDLNTNNSMVYTQVVGPSRITYIDDTQPLFTSGVGIGAVGGVLVSRYNLTQAGTVSSITPTFSGAGAGATTYQVQLYDATGAGGTPGTLLYTSPTQTRPTASGSSVISVPNVAIAAGDFFVGVKELDLNVGLAYQLENPLRPTTFYYQVPAGAWTPVNNTTLRTRLALEVGIAPPPACAAVQSLTATAVTGTSASLTFTGVAGATYTVTYQAAGGAVQTVTPAPSASPVPLSGLTPGTTYTVNVTTNCAGGATSAVSTLTFSTPILNDDPAGAITLPVAATCTPTSSTNVGATTTVATGLGYTNPGCGIATSPKDVFFKFTTAAVGVGSTAVQVVVTGSAAGQVRVFSSVGGAAGPFVSVGCAAGTTNNTVAAPLRVTGLTPNTTYYIFVSGYGSADTQGAFTICVTGLATPTPAAYTTLPYTEGFEGPWIDVLATRDVPTVNWRNTPVTGNNSWRREDDGFSSAGWSYLADETGATPPYAIRSSVGAHSARFHSFGADPSVPATSAPGTLDLYANMSGTGTKRLDFDYINPTGTDKLEVLVSTDGGTTFGAPVLTANTNATFTAKTVNIASTSATTVIRFRATSDFGNDDIGMDNLRLTVVTATTNEQLAAAMSLYPNPAHQSFQLVVPAGSLNKASATLINALGQVVQTRQLNLPAAGGTEQFNVSGLAAGVYSLQLKSGSDTVVKRVVVE